MLKRNKRFGSARICSSGSESNNLLARGLGQIIGRTYCTVHHGTLDEISCSWVDPVFPETYNMLPTTRAWEKSWLWGTFSERASLLLSEDIFPVSHIIWTLMYYYCTRGVAEERVFQVGLVTKETPPFKPVRTTFIVAPARENSRNAE